MPASTTRTLALVAITLGLGCATGLGCAAKGSDMAMAPNDAAFAPPPPAAEQAAPDPAMDLPMDESEPAPDPMADLETYEQQLRDYEQRLRKAGVRLRTGLPGGGVPGESAKERPQDLDRDRSGKSGGEASRKNKGGSSKRPSSKKGPAPATPSKPSADGAGGAAGIVGGADAEEAAAPSRCETVCSLQEAICGLQDKICGLAEEHPEEMRYAEGCMRARDDCAVASEACDDCGPS